MLLRLSDPNAVPVINGSHVGLFPALAEERLANAATLLHSSANPRMDLVLLITKDAPNSAGKSSGAPPGMSAAQFALVQRMMTRQRGAQASSPAQVAEPKRGPQINLSLWRFGQDSSSVWQVPLSVDRLLDPLQSDSLPNQIHLEDLRIHDISWSPEGDRVAVLLSIRRSSSPAQESTAQTSERTATYLKTFSVQDGRLCSTVRVGQHREVNEPFQSTKQITWTSIESVFSRPTQVESLLKKLRPLPSLPKADQFASGPPTNLMPHQMRLMQMGMQKNQASFELPSSGAPSGRGPLRDFPCLSRSGVELGLVDRHEQPSSQAQTAGENPDVLDLHAETVVVLTCSESRQAHLILDGTISLASFKVEELNGTPAASLYAFPRPDLSSIDVLSIEQDQDSMQSVVKAGRSILTLPLGQGDATTSALVGDFVSKMSRLSHFLQIFVGYSLDTAAIVRQIWKKDIQEGIISEWERYGKELNVKFGCDMKQELLSSLLTGRASPAMEHLLLATLTDGTLMRFEQNTHLAFARLKQMLFSSLRPALERVLMCLRECDGLLTFSEVAIGLSTDRQSNLSSSRAKPFIDDVKRLLALSLELSELVDLEAVALHEFLRWCRFEKERQERLKQDQEDPRLPINHDVLTVAEFVERGFLNQGIDAILGPASESLGNAQDKMLSAESTTSLQEVLTLSKGHLQQDDARCSARFTATDSPQPSKLFEGLEECLNKMGMSLRITIAQYVGSTTASKITTLTDLRVGALSTATSYIDSLVSTVAGHTDSPASPVVRHYTRVDATGALENVSAFCTETSAVSPTVEANGLTILKAEPGSLERKQVSLQLEEPEAGGALKIVDFGFFNNDDLALLIRRHAPDGMTNHFLGMIRYSDLEVNTTPAPRPAAFARVTQFEAKFDAVRISLNGMKKTVAVMDQSGSRVVYLDLTSYDDALDDIQKGSEAEDIEESMQIS